MTAAKTLLIITASNGENLKLGQKFQSIAKNLEFTNCEVIDLTEINLPLYNPRLSTPENLNNRIKKLYDQINSFSHWIICAPEYNGSIPPLLTNAIAWLSVESDDFRHLFNGRPIAIVSYSGGECMSLLFSLRIQLTHLGAQVLGRQLASNKSKPPKDESIKAILYLLQQMQPLQFEEV